MAAANGARVILPVVLLAAAALAGCVGGVREYYGFDPDPQYKNPGVFPGNYTYNNGGSNVLQAGLLKKGLPEIIRLRSTLPAYPAPNGEETSDGAVFISMAVWRPQNVTGPVPIIIDAGPYFENGSHCSVPNQNPCRGQMIDDTIDYPGQTTPFLLRNFQPRGYAVVQLAVRGTGTSGGCMDLMGPSEMHDLDQAVTYLAEQPWSNGNVAMIGASYDGSTPWEVAAAGNPHLKAIIPVSGLPDAFDLMFHNGTAETRGEIMHSVVYWPFGFSDGFPADDLPVAIPASPVPLPVDPASPPGTIGQANGRESYQDTQNLLCPEAWRGAAMGPFSAATGDRGAAGSDYWTIRDHRQAVLDNYKGSVFLVHGLQDWNVDPHSAIPFNTQLRAKGFEMKEWYGQWDHAFPDSGCAAYAPTWVTTPCRLDYADVLGRWLDHYLKGDTSQALGPGIQVEDDLGQWRNADSFPPVAPDWTSLHLTADLKLGAEASQTTAMVRLTPGAPSQKGTVVELRSAPFANDTHISGMPQLTVPFTAEGPGGQLGAWLFDVDPLGNARSPYAAIIDGVWQPVGVPIVGHAQMNLRYHDGGESMQPIVPGQAYVARMQFEPLEVQIPQGHSLVLWLFQGTYNDHQSTGTPSSVDVQLGGDGAALKLPVVHVDPRTIFPVPGVHFPQRDLLDRMDVLQPTAAPTCFATLPLNGLPSPCLNAATTMRVELP